jgi:heme exporter protein C
VALPEIAPTLQQGKLKHRDTIPFILPHSPALVKLAKPRMKNAFILCTGITLVLLGYGTYQGLVVAPREETMGDAQRIFYYHVPAATAAYSLFFVNFAASIIYLWKRSTRADAWALAAAEVGLVFATVTLALGMIWARYAWGHWWAWDMRLTTFLILWLLYISYRMLRRSAEAGSTSVLAAALAVMVLSMSRSITWQTAGSAPTIPSQ